MSAVAVGGVPEGYPEAVARGIASSFAALCLEMGAEFGTVRFLAHGAGDSKPCVYVEAYDSEGNDSLSIASEWLCQDVMPR